MPAHLTRSRRRAELPWLEDQIPRLGNEYLLTYLDADLSLQHIGVLILTLMGVHRRSEGPRSDQVLDQREVTVGLLSPDHEPYAELTEPHRLALIRREHFAHPLVHQLLTNDLLPKFDKHYVYRT